MTEIDSLLSASLRRLAEPGDPAGVVQAIEARLAQVATETGTSAKCRSP
jgi:hypothetical protein